MEQYYKINDQTIYLIDNLFIAKEFDNLHHIIRNFSSLKIIEGNKNYHISALPHIFFSKELICFDSGNCYKQPIEPTKNMRHLVIRSNYDRHLFLSKNLISFETSFTISELGILNKKMVCLTLGLDQIFCRPNPKSVCELLNPNQTRTQTQTQTFLSKNLIFVHINGNVNNPIQLPKHIFSLKLGLIFSQPLIITKNLRILQFHPYKHTLIIENPFDILEIKNHMTFPPPKMSIILWDNLPNGIKHIHSSNTFHPHANIPNNMINCLNKKMIYTIKIKDDDMEI